MNALKLAEESQPIKSRPSVCLNMIGTNMRAEYDEVVAKKGELVAQFHILNTIESELLAHLQLAGVL